MLEAILAQNVLSLASFELEVCLASVGPFGPGQAMEVKEMYTLAQASFANPSTMVASV